MNAAGGPGGARPMPVEPQRRRVAVGPQPGLGRRTASSQNFPHALGVLRSPTIRGYPRPSGKTRNTAIGRKIVSKGYIDELILVYGLRRKALKIARRRG